MIWQENKEGSGKKVRKAAGAEAWLYVGLHMKNLKPRMWNGPGMWLS